MEDKAAANVAIRLEQIERAITTRPESYHEQFAASFDDMLRHMAPDATEDQRRRLQHIDSWHRLQIGRSEAALQQSRGFHIIDMLEDGSPQSVEHPPALMEIAALMQAGRSVPAQLRTRASHEQELQRIEARRAASAAPESTAVITVSGERPFTTRYIVLDPERHSTYFAALREVQRLRAQRQHDWRLILGR